MGRGAGKGKSLGNVGMQKGAPGERIRDAEVLSDISEVQNGWEQQKAW